jgi:hypothetical protein
LTARAGPGIDGLSSMTKALLIAAGAILLAVGLTLGFLSALNIQWLLTHPATGFRAHDQQPVLAIGIVALAALASAFAGVKTISYARRRKR